MNKNILIIYHTQTGNTKKIVDACVNGIQKEDNISIKLIEALHATIEHVIWADGIILATPENFGYMSGAMKNFFDRTYYPARDLAISKPYALLISCETDGEGTVRSIQTIAKGYILKETLEPLIIKEDRKSVV